MRTYTLCSKTTNPHHNLALEEYLLRHHTQNDTCILYLWQNQHTVVIGKNQHCQTECNTSLLCFDGGTVARRSSGGGAVYHDLGNLNFTFLAGHDVYDLSKQLLVITTALARLGVPAVLEGRNDICIAHKKISGNAFYSSKAGRLHHGTLMLNVDKDRLSKYLNVPKEKLSTKGVASVRSRVANIVDYCPHLTVDALRQALFSAFEDIYETKATNLDEAAFDKEQLNVLYHQYASDAFIFGTSPTENLRFKKRFPWGEADLRLHVEDNKIRSAVLYSDAMDGEYVSTFANALKGNTYTLSTFTNAAKSAADGTLHAAQMPGDLLQFIEEAMKP